jgi:Cu(I)/Ag(I) efflux system protein CusF
MKPHTTALFSALFSARFSALFPALLPALLLVLASPLPASVHAADVHDPHAGHGMTASSANANASTQLVEGQVKKIDKAGGKVTVTHGPLTNLDMPAMTMVFRVKEAAWLNRLQPEQKIRFVADSINGVLTIVRLDVAK